MRRFWLVTVAIASLTACSPISTPASNNSGPQNLNPGPISSQTGSTSVDTEEPSAEPAELEEGQSQLSKILSALAISAENPAGYDRDLFDHWVDADSDGCNTRREVLIMESLTEVTVGSSCNLLGGSWLSAYDEIRSTEYSDFDIDHMVPLKEAWDSGAHAWDADTRKRFANDLGFEGSLIAVTASSNRSKSDRDPAQWLPSNSSYICKYTADWLAVKYRWRLSIDSQEALALGSLVAACDDFEMQIPPKATVFSAGAKPQATVGNDPKFESCKEAKANGYGPYLQGIDPEYDWYRDGDSDGTVCE